MLFRSGHKSLLSAIVGVFDERHRRDLGRYGLAAHHQLDLRAVGRLCAFDVAHGDGATQRRREAARCDLADDPAPDRDLCAFARRTENAVLVVGAESPFARGQAADELMDRVSCPLVIVR